MSGSSKSSNYSPVLIAFISLSVFIFIILQYTEFSNDKKEKDIRAELDEVLISKKSQLEKALYSRIYYTKGVAAYITINPQIDAAIFDNLANELIKDDTVISTMSISPSCIISAIYPMKGHESAIGLNLLEHPERKKIVEKTIQTKNTFIAGPVELIEGGVAFISYTPVFLKHGSDSTSFWGMTDIVIMKDKLFNEIKLTNKDDKYVYALKGIDGTGVSGKAFWGDENIFSNNPVKVEVLLPTGTWVFAAMPIEGWGDYIDNTEAMIIFLYISAFIISMLIFLLSRAMIKLRINERELTALFGSMQDIVIQINSKGEYIKIASANQKLLFKPKDELLNKSLYEIFDKEKADFFMDAVTRCLSTKKLVEIEYPLIIDSKEFWFNARLSYLSEDAVVYVAYDNTYKKRAEDKLIESEKKMQELNRTKDKFFSIIAHDLKNPFITIIGFSDLLITEYYDFTDEEKIHYLQEMKKSAHLSHNLLQNLLQWSRSQTGHLEFIPCPISLYALVSENIQLLGKSADKKGVKLSTDISNELIVFADEDMLNTILRNLISNAIKFSSKEDTITISAFETNDSVGIDIADTGTGMEQSRVESLFKLEETKSTAGTDSESGTGLGLLICKEFVEKHNGKISVTSQLGKGTTFRITLPKKS
ncbi:MAG: ATP-binding protein [Melioribacteraceae bacterium]|nr:ATP-binding protein [Melioribacteraceae bacterium]